MSFPSFGDVARFVELAGQIYTYGFTRSHRAPSLYNAFGENVKHLATNLGDLQKVLEAINENCRYQPADIVPQDAIGDVIGNYQTTLQECDSLLKDKAKFSWQGDFIHNVIWNYNVASDVQDLKDRLAFLNIKLLTVLKTLDLKMAHRLNINIFRIHHDLASRIDGAREDIIQQVQEVRTIIWNALTDPTNAAAASLPTQTSRFDIPRSLEMAFEQQTGTSDAENRHFPMVRGLDAVAYHINAANNIPADSRDGKRERQWLEIAKGLWLINKVKAGQEYISACSFRSSYHFEIQISSMGITIASYVKGLQVELMEIVKFTDLQSFIPDADIMLDIFRENAGMWLESRESLVPTPSWELEFSEKIMSVSLQGPYPEFDQSLHLFRLTEVDLKLVTSDVPRNGAASRERYNNNVNVDLRRARYIPLYASGTSSLTALNVKFQGDSLTPGSAALSFKKRSDLFKFQHAITGYQVPFEALHIQVTTYASSGFFGGKVVYTGRLQLWRAKRPANIPSDDSSSSTESSSSPTTPATSTNITATSPDLSTNGGSSSMPRSPNGMPDFVHPNRRDSAATISSKFSPGRRASTITTSSALSVAQSRLKSPASSFQTSVVDKEGNIGIVLDKPEDSMLILYLEQTKKTSVLKERSFLAIQLEDATHIEISSCDCRKPDSSCLRSVIQKSSSDRLITYRHNVGTDLDAWNLAQIGQWQRKSLLTTKDKIMWVAIDFETMPDKLHFEEMFMKLKKLSTTEHKRYYADLENLRS